MHIVNTISRKHSLKTLNLKAKKMDLSGWIAEKIKMSKSPEHFCLLMGGRYFQNFNCLCVECLTGGEVRREELWRWASNGLPDPRWKLKVLWILSGHQHLVVYKTLSQLHNCFFCQPLQRSLAKSISLGLKIYSFQTMLAGDSTCSCCLAYARNFGVIMLWDGQGRKPN